jgi:hypothetical protein
MFTSDPWAELIEVDFGALSPNPLTNIPNASSTVAEQLAWITKVWKKLQAALKATGTLTDDSVYLDANNPAVAAGQLRAYMARYQAALGAPTYSRYDKALATLQGNAVISSGKRNIKKDTASPAVDVFQASSSSLEQTTQTSLIEAAEAGIPDTSVPVQLEPAAVYDELPIAPEGAAVLTTFDTTAPTTEASSDLMTTVKGLWDETPTWLKWLGGGVALGGVAVGLARRL